MNRRGFTLVELIAMMVVIGVLMLITVPNITGIIQKNRESVAVADINKMVGSAEAKMQSKDAPKLKVGECIVFSLKHLDGNSDINVGVNGGNYDKTQSVVVVSKQKIDNNGTNKLKYYIGLLEYKSVGSRYSSYYTQDEDGYPRLIDYEEFSKNPEDNVPVASPRNGDYYMYLNQGYPNGALSYVNNYARKHICDSVVAVYIK